MQMEGNMRGNGRMAKEMEKGFYFLQMERNMMDNLRIIKEMGKEL